MKQPFTFQVSLWRSLCWTTGRCAWLPPFFCLNLHFWISNSFKQSEQLAIFRFSPCRKSFGWTTCRWAWLHLFFHEKSGNRTCFRCGFSFFWWSLVRFKCARNSGVDNLSNLQGCDMKAEGLWALSRKMHVMWMHFISSTSSPLVPLSRARFPL